MKRLVITEKPSVAIDISKVLGEFSRQDGYLEGKDMIITWAVGHLIELTMPQDYDPALEKWDINTLPIIPEPFRLKPKKATEKQLRTIKSLIARQDVDRLIDACDAGREGELIFRYILQYLNCTKPHDRLWLSETTPTAVRNAFTNLRSSTEVDNLSKAAIARSQADWLVGLNATRGFTVQNGDKFTVGRVQTPTLALIVNRESEILSFVAEPYWEIQATFNADVEDYTGKWFRAKQNRFLNKAEAQAIYDKLLPGSPATIASVKQKEIRELPPQLFNLNDLQKEANKKYGITAEQTLNTAQKLYEQKLLTYPRTDSRHLTTAMADTLPGRLRSLLRTEFGLIVKSITGELSDKRYVDDTKVTDHTAIIITDYPLGMDSLSELERQIYLLVARRVVGVFLPAARFSHTEVVTSVQDETFKSKVKTVLDIGWKVLYSKDDEDSEQLLPMLIEKQNINLKKADLLDKQTKPPKRYTEADLLGAMENAGKQMDDKELQEAMQGKGLGTPATRAAIIEKLIAVEYITRQKKNLVPTDKGKYLITKVSPLLKNPEMTGEWEKKLLDIEHGKYHSKIFLDEIKQMTTDIVADIKKQEVVYMTPIKDSLGACPLCGKAVIAGKMAFGCSAWKQGCKFTIWKKIAGKKISEAQAKKILETGKSNLIKGFTSKKGTNFDAYLKLDGDRTVFEFP